MKSVKKLQDGQQRAATEGKNERRAEERGTRKERGIGKKRRDGRRHWEN